MATSIENINTTTLSINELLKGEISEETRTTTSGWVRTLRTSSSILAFCNMNDGSCPSGLQVIISNRDMPDKLCTKFTKTVKMGSYIQCSGNIVKSTGKGQKYEMRLLDFKLIGKTGDGYPLSKNKLTLDYLRQYPHLRARTNTFGSVFRIRSALMKSLHDFYHNKSFLHLDPNIITVNECEGGAGVFQITEKDITRPENLALTEDGNYNWETDHFNTPTYLTVSSQLQLEAMACALGNVYTVNKSFRSEHSNTNKHVSEFIHLEIEMINNTLDDLMDISEEMIKYSIGYLFDKCQDDIANLGKFISPGLVDNLTKLQQTAFTRLEYTDAVKMLNKDLSKNSKLPYGKIEFGEDLSSAHENYITQKYNKPVFITNWASSIKSFYMKQLDTENSDNTLKLCQAFDLLMRYGIGELIGGSQREDKLEVLLEMMEKKNIDIDKMAFYVDLRKYGSCPHGGFGLGLTV